MPLDEDARLAKLQQQFEFERASGESTGAIDAELMFALIAGIKGLREQIQALAGADAKARTVATLPLAAPVGVLLRKPGDTSLYMGNGPGEPLSRYMAA